MHPPPIAPQPPFLRVRDPFPRFFSAARATSWEPTSFSSAAAQGAAHAATTATCSCPAAQRRDASTTHAVRRRPAPSVARRRAHPSMEQRL
ncbi:hypothetical protein PAHAL_1G140900 [Panicum hallii]|uniref:Uncharacterized protein n=1 Tax=Panicum hallii TaxID=206008 RepID=A0A2T8KV68_9POAL|nr:hypothetical protein PAHAL_1G140900 [Panicum hallii]